MPLSTPGQKEFDYLTDHNQDWIALMLVIEEFEEELSLQKNRLLFNLANWLLALGMFQKFEDRKMIDAAPNRRDREYHRAVLTSLLATGERLLLEITKHKEIDPCAIGVKLSELEASVETLRMNYQEWFMDLKPQRKEDIITEVFGGGS